MQNFFSYLTEPYSNCFILTFGAFYLTKFGVCQAGKPHLSGQQRLQIIKLRISHYPSFILSDSLFIRFVSDLHLNTKQILLFRTPLMMFI